MFHATQNRQPVEGEPHALLHRIAQHAAWQLQKSAGPPLFAKVQGSCVRATVFVFRSSRHTICADERCMQQTKSIDQPRATKTKIQNPKSKKTHIGFGVGFDTMSPLFYCSSAHSRHHAQHKLRKIRRRSTAFPQGACRVKRERELAPRPTRRCYSVHAVTRDSFFSL